MSRKRRWPVVFLLDVDNTLLDNDRIVRDLRAHLKLCFGAARERRYWTIFKERRARMGYADYLGALQSYRLERPHDPHMLRMSLFLLDYPFPKRLYPKALDVIARLGKLGPTVIVSDGDEVFQPLKVEHSGLYDAVEGRALIYVRKDKSFDDVERRFPAQRYVMIDDKLKLLAAAKRRWGSKVITVFPRQGHYARDPELLAAHPPEKVADLAVERIGDLLRRDIPGLEPKPRRRETGSPRGSASRG